MFHVTSGGPSNELVTRTPPSRSKADVKSPIMNKKALFFNILEPKVNEGDNGTRF